MTFFIVVHGDADIFLAIQAAQVLSRVSSGCEGPLTVSGAVSMCHCNTPDASISTVESRH